MHDDGVQCKGWRSQKHLQNRIELKYEKSERERKNERRNVAVVAFWCSSYAFQKEGGGVKNDGKWTVWGMPMHVSNKFSIYVSHTATLYTHGSFICCANHQFFIECTCIQGHNAMKYFRCLSALSDWIALFAKYRTIALSNFSYVIINKLTQANNKN